MCGTCGCGRPEAGPVHVHVPHEHAHGHLHEREHADAHAPVPPALEARRVAVERSLLEANDARAAGLARRLAARGVDAISLVGAPGAGKTALLEATFAALGAEAGREAVVEGDCATDLDARRLARLGARVAQVTTGAVCHLDAALVEAGLARLDLAGVRRLWIENVGNLVCPAAFACGEARRVALVSVPEGDDKPAKYPALFAGADLLVVSKADLLPHVDFDLERCLGAARAVRPGLACLVVSARTGQGLDAWSTWLEGGRA